MAVTPVSLGPSLRVWAMAGVTHILCDGPVDPVYCGAESAPLSRPASVSPTARSDRALGVAGTGQKTSPTVLPGTPSIPKQTASGEGVPARAEPGGQSQTITSSMLRFAPAEGVPVDPAAWPEPWKSWFSRIAPASVLWTYHELGADLTGIGRSAERSAFFKTCIGELGLPKGSSVFWPCAMPAAREGEDACLQACPAVFSAGLLRLAPQFVIVFGETALADMGLGGRILPFRQEMVEGKLLLCLPEIGVLLQNQGQRASAVSLLRAVLRSSDSSGR